MDRETFDDAIRKMFTEYGFTGEEIDQIKSMKSKFAPRQS